MGSFCSVIDTDQKVIPNGGELFLIEGTSLRSFHNLIGAIIFRISASSSKQGMGSCILLSQNLILTAAHNIYDKKNNRQFFDFKFYLGDSVTTQNYYEIESWTYMNQFKSIDVQQKLQFEFALMKLKKPIKCEFFLPLQQPCQICLKTNTQSFVQIFGYPLYGQNFKCTDKYGLKKQIKQYGVSRRNIIEDINKFKIAYKITTYPGHSGCPVIVSNKIIAIHNGAGKENQKFNIGRLITKDMISTLIKWRQQLNGQPFLVQDYQCQHMVKRKPQNSSNMQTASKIFEKGKDAYINQDYLQASKQFQFCLSIQEKINGTDELSIARTLTYIGASNEKRNNYSQALAYYLQSHKIYLKNKREQSLQICQNLNNIGWIYYNQGKYAQSIEKYQNCIKILVDKNSKEKLYAAVLCNLGIAYYKQQKYRQAIKLHLQSLQIYEKQKMDEWVKNNALNIIKCLKALNQIQKMQQTSRMFDIYGFINKRRILNKKVTQKQ